MARKSGNGPSLSKATYKASKGRARRSPAQEKSEHEQTVRSAEKSRDFHKLTKKVGLLGALQERGFLPKKPK